MDRQTIKTNAKACLSANYWPLVGYSLLASIIAGAVGAAGSIPFVGIIISVILLPVITCGMCYMFYLIYKGEKPDITYMFEGFKDGKMMHVVGGYWYMVLFQLLWTLLLVIPGIIKGYAYSMTPYILIDQPEIPATEALKKSMKMTDGHKWEIFVFQLSFIGWALLSVITCGLVGIFYFVPYYSVALGGIYDNLKYLDQGAAVDVTAEAIEENIESPADDSNDMFEN